MENATAFERRRFEKSKSRAFERAVAFALKRKVESVLRTRARNFFDFWIAKFLYFAQTLVAALASR